MSEYRETVRILQGATCAGGVSTAAPGALGSLRGPVDAALLTGSLPAR
jgi:hypothetical protein